MNDENLNRVGRVEDHSGLSVRPMSASDGRASDEAKTAEADPVDGADSARMQRVRGVRKCQDKKGNRVWRAVHYCKRTGRQIEVGRYATHAEAVDQLTKFAKCPELHEHQRREKRERKRLMYELLAEQRYAKQREYDLGITACKKDFALLVQYPELWHVPTDPESGRLHILAIPPKVRRACFQSVPVEDDPIYLHARRALPEGGTLEECGELYGVTREYIRQIEAKACKSKRSVMAEYEGSGPKSNHWDDMGCR